MIPKHHTGVTLLRANKRWLRLPPFMLPPLMLPPRMLPPFMLPPVCLKLLPSSSLGSILLALRRGRRSSSRWPEHPKRIRKGYEHVVNFLVANHVSNSCRISKVIEQVQYLDPNASPHLAEASAQPDLSLAHPSATGSEGPQPEQQLIE